MLLHFDYDGVIVDSFDQLLAAAQRATTLSGVGRPPTREDFETMEDFTTNGIAARLGIPRDQMQIYGARLHTLLIGEAHAPPPFPGIPAMLRTLAAHHTIVIITSNLTPLVQRGLRGAQLEGCVSLILDALRPGTKGDKIQRALEQFESPPRESFMIGDTRSDIRHGKAAGVRTIAVTWGYQKRHILEQEQPDWFVDSPDELLKVLSRGTAE